MIYTPTPKATASSIVNLLNPLSSITGERATYVPDAVLQTGRQLFKNNADDKTTLIWKAGNIAAVSSAIVLLSRLIQHAGQQRILQPNAKAQDKMRKDMDTVRPAFIDARRKNASQDISISGINDYIFGDSWQRAAAWVPAAALLLGYAITHRTTDDILDKIELKRAKKRGAEAKQRLDDAVIARAALARDNMQSQQLQQAIARMESKKASVTKTASGLSDLIRDVLPIGGQLSGDAAQSIAAAVNLLAAAVTVAGFAGGFGYGKSTNKNRIQYKNARKARQEYARQRSVYDTLDHAPISAQTIAAIQGNTKNKKRNMRQIPELPEGLQGAPIGVDI